MLVEIEDVGGETFSQYAQITIAFEVESVLRVEPLDGGLGGSQLREENAAVVSGALVAS